MVDTPTRTVVAGFPDEQAARLATVSLRQLRYWAKDGFMPPSLDLSDRGFPGSRLYSFRDLVCLRVLGQLKNVHRVSLQHLRRTKASLAHLGDDLWAKTTLYVLGRRVVVYNPEAGLTEVVSGQGVMTIPLTVDRKSHV